MILSVWGLTLALLAWSLKRDRGRTWRALEASVMGMRRIFPGTFLMVIAFGILLALVSKERLVALFDVQGAMGLGLISLVGAVITLPGPIAFPLVGSLAELGIEKSTLASFVTTLTMVGIVSAPFEAGFFGRKFTILRQAFSLVAAVLIGLMMKEIL